MSRPFTVGFALLVWGYMFLAVGAVHILVPDPMTTPEWPTEDDLFEPEELVNEWSAYLDNPHVLNNCRIFLERLWNYQFDEPT